jgi:CRISPR-associated protein Cmr2
MTDYTKKLAAWLHDPAEKQLVLLRDPEGHEGGTARRLREALDISKHLFNPLADHLAAAASSAGRPTGRTGRARPTRRDTPSSKRCASTRKPS